jgi:large subunit ribosomal protein L25
MEKIVLQAVQRPVIGKQVKALRREGKLPAVIYGRHTAPMPIVLDHKDASRALTGIAPSALVTVEVDGEPYQTLVREKQRNPILGSPDPRGFLAVSMTETLHATVMVRMEGVSPAVKDYDAILMTGENELQVECLPQDLPERITVDVSVLKAIGDGLYVRDLKVSDKIKILTDPDTMLVMVTSQAAEEEVVVPEAAAVTAAVTTEPEVMEHGKKEEEEF